MAHLLDALEADLDEWRLAPRLVVALLAIGALWTPVQSRFVALAGAQLATFILLAPPTSNHPWLLAIVNAAILIERFSLGRKEDGDWVPLARTALLIAYSAAALSKLNSTFFDPVASCANFIAEIASFQTLDLDTQILPWIIAGTELAIAGLLITPRTRSLGVRIGVTFHFLVSLSPAVGVRDFSATLFALFALFLPEDELSQIPERVGRILLNTPVLRAGVQRWFVGLIVIGAFMAGELAPFGVGWILFTVLGCVVVFAIWATPMQRPSPRIGRTQKHHYPLLLVVGLIIASPYVGLSTAPAFTPFSNLRTEGPGTNHFVLPSLHLTDHQVQILRLDKVSIDGVVTTSKVDRLTHSSVRLLGSTNPDVRIWGVDQATDKRFDGVLASSFGEPSFAERYLLSFRFVPSLTDPVCTP